MAQAFFYCMDYRVLDNMTLRRSVELTFPAGFEADVSDHASLEPSAAFSPVIWYTTFRSTDEYATFLAAFADYLLYHFPSLVTPFEALDLLPSVRRIDLMNAMSAIIQPGVAPVVWNG